MTPDVNDTIVAIASARGGAARGVVRLSGSDALGIVAALCGEPIIAPRPSRLANRRLLVDVGGARRGVPADLCVWPDERSYTRQPSVETHTVGSPPVLDAIVRACVSRGARLAEPGEFTLRAFLAGRLDLTQAEAVLSVIDARSDGRLAAALEQLAGGLSTPLHRLRADLLSLLADLEAGLDFVEEEDIRFVEPSELRRRLSEAAGLVTATAQQIAGRDTADRPPRVAIVGPPNVGKSRLFNALVGRYGRGDGTTKALVADAVGVTRDMLVAPVEFEGVRAELVDTAGADETAAIDAIDGVARGRLSGVLRDADVLVECRRSDCIATAPAADRIGVATMSDRYPIDSEGGWLLTSAATGEGLTELAHRIAADVVDKSRDTLGATADRCRAGLAQASEALSRAVDAVEAGDELVSLELREALDGLGRVVGEVVTEEVLGEIFGRFCIGK